jgi:hypothetical protein
MQEGSYPGDRTIQGPKLFETRYNDINHEKLHPGGMLEHAVWPSWTFSRSQIKELRTMSDGRYCRAITFGQRETISRVDILPTVRNDSRAIVNESNAFGRANMPSPVFSFAPDSRCPNEIYVMYVMHSF